MSTRGVTHTTTPSALRHGSIASADALEVDADVLACAAEFAHWPDWAAGLMRDELRWDDEALATAIDPIDALHGLATQRSRPTVATDSPPCRPAQALALELTAGQADRSPLASAARTAHRRLAYGP
jgi:hypothetical protein